MSACPSGRLPAGVNFDARTVSFSGTPAAGSGGVYPLLISATNGTAPDAVLPVVLRVNAAPTFNAVAPIHFRVGTSGQFTVSAAGFPLPLITMSGALPTGVGFDPIGGRISGAPAVGSDGTYPLEFTATNRVAPAAILQLTLTVDRAPAAVVVPPPTSTVPPPAPVPVAAPAPAPASPTSGSSTPRHTSTPTVPVVVSIGGGGGGGGAAGPVAISAPPVAPHLPDVQPDVVTPTVDIAPLVAESDVPAEVVPTVDAAPSPLTVDLEPLAPDENGDYPPSNLQVGLQPYALTVTDTAGAPVTAFDPPLVLTLVPTDDAPEAVEGDPTQLEVQLLDADLSDFVPLDAIVNDDGSLSLTLTSIVQLPVPVPPSSDVVADAP